MNKVFDSSSDFVYDPKKIGCCNFSEKAENYINDLIKKAPNWYHRFNKIVLLSKQGHLIIDLNLSELAFRKKSHGVHSCECI